MVPYVYIGLGSSFDPILLFSLKRKRIPKYGTIAGMLIDTISTIIYANTKLNDFITGRITSFVLATIAVVVGSLLTPEKK
ncbi:MAG: hypothetical protein ABIN61_03705 [candidate division WOR-3 bacterium]